MQVAVERVVRLQDGRSMGYAQYGSGDGLPVVNAHVVSLAGSTSRQRTWWRSKPVSG